MLVVGSDQLSNLDKHLLFFLLLLNIIFGHELSVGLDDGSFLELLLGVDIDGEFAGGVGQFGNQDLYVPVADDAERFNE